MPEPPATADGESPRASSAMRAQDQGITALREFQMLQDAHTEQDFIVVHTGIQRGANAPQFKRAQGEAVDGGEANRHRTVRRL